MTRFFLRLAIRDLRHDRFHQAAAGDQFRTLNMPRGEECSTRRVDEGNLPQIKANGRPRTGDESALPAIVQLPYPIARQPSFELERHRFRIVMDSNPEHHFTSPSMNTSNCWPT